MQDQKAIIKKLAKLEQVKSKLKKEFVGIDLQIDQIVDSIRTWYCFPESLNRPLVVNLWGITGTFKTSIIRRLVELLGRSTGFKEIDSRAILSSKFDALLGITEIEKVQGNKDLPEIILIDEFQNVKTLDAFGNDTKDSKTLYELFSILSDGKLKYPRNMYSLGKLTNIVKQIKENPEKCYGVLKEKVDIILDQYLERLEREKKRKVEVIDNEDSIFTLSTKKINSREAHYTIGDAFWDNNYYQLEDFKEFQYAIIAGFKNDHKALFDYIVKTVEGISKDITIDLSKSLIFVAGNLDNIFSGLTHSIDTDSITPDEFYEYSKQVNFNDVKNCLLENFKPEQVSRLGTNHVIFPSFNSKMYKKLISGLNKRTLAKFKEQKIEIIIDPSVDAFLLKHGAIPSQGARSILSSHEFVVDSNISELIALAILNGTKKATLSVKYNMLVLKAKKEIVIKDISIIDTKVLANYEEPLNSIISTHESGHSIAVIALMGKYPDMVKVRSSDGDIGGYVKYTPEILPTKQDMKHRLAISMAGYAAEMLVHGADNVSSGASSDILSATAVASSMVKVLGMGDGMSANGFSMGRDTLVLNDKDRLDQEVDDLISEAFTLAMTVLIFYRKELDILTRKLKTCVTMKEEEIRKLLKM